MSEPTRRWLWPLLVLALVLAVAGGATAVVREPTKHTPVTRTITSASVNTYAEYVNAVKADWARVTAASEGQDGRYGWAMMATALRTFADALGGLTPPSQLEFKHNELVAEARSTADLADERDREIRADPNAKDTGNGFQALARLRALGVRIAAL